MKNHQFQTIKFQKILMLICISLILFSCEQNTTKPDDHYYDPDLATHRFNWSFASEPVNCNLPKGNINYFNSQDFIMSDVYDDSLLTNNEMNEKVHLLRSKLIPNPNPGALNNWSGIMQYLDEPLNITNLNYIECQILENAEVFPEIPVTMHLDLGLMSEDSYQPGLNYVPDEEDGIVLKDGLLDYGEDVGLDQIGNGEVGDDPHDNYSSEKIYVNGFEEYPYINGTEGNDRLDTEDLDNNDALNLMNSYIHYSFTLDEEEYLYSTNSKGLQTYRIPVNDMDVITENGITPNFENLQYMRIWFEYPEETYVILISLRFVDPENDNYSRDFIKTNTPDFN